MKRRFPSRSVSDRVDPRSAVWSGVAWDGEGGLLAADMHFARLARHARRLDIEMPADAPKQIFEALATLERPGEPVAADGQPPFVIKARVDSSGEIFLEAFVNHRWPTVPLDAISLSAPNWEQPVRGTKHADWQPHINARETAIAHGAHIALLFEDEILVDGDRCTPLLLDHDGVAYHPLHSGGALDSVTIEQIRPALEAAGIPVSGARLTLSMILRASEMLVVGSGMGIRAVGTIDGRTIGRPQGRLFQVAWESWLTRLESGWGTAEDL